MQKPKGILTIGHNHERTEKEVIRDNAYMFAYKLGLYEGALFSQRPNNIAIQELMNAFRDQHGGVSYRTPIIGVNDET